VLKLKKIIPAPKG